MRLRAATRALFQSGGKLMRRSTTAIVMRLERLICVLLHIAAGCSQGGHAMRPRAAATCSDFASKVDTLCWNALL